MASALASPSWVPCGRLCGSTTFLSGRSSGLQPVWALCATPTCCVSHALSLCCESLCACKNSEGVEHCQESLPVTLMQVLLILSAMPRKELRHSFLVSCKGQSVQSPDRPCDVDLPVLWNFPGGCCPVSFVITLTHCRPSPEKAHADGIPCVLQLSTLEGLP